MNSLYNSIYIEEIKSKIVLNLLNAKNKEFDKFNIYLFGEKGTGKTTFLNKVINTDNPIFESSNTKLNKKAINIFTSPIGLKFYDLPGQGYNRKEANIINTLILDLENEQKNILLEKEPEIVLQNYIDFKFIKNEKYKTKDFLEDTSNKINLILFFVKTANAQLNPDEVKYLESLLKKEYQIIFVLNIQVDKEKNIETTTPQNIQNVFDSISKVYLKNNKSIVNEKLICTLNCLTGKGISKLMSIADLLFNHNDLLPFSYITSLQTAQSPSLYKEKIQEQLLIFISHLANQKGEDIKLVKRVMGEVWSFSSALRKDLFASSFSAKLDNKLFVSVVRQIRKGLKKSIHSFDTEDSLKISSPNKNDIYYFDVYGLKGVTLVLSVFIAYQILSKKRARKIDFEFIYELVHIRITDAFKENPISFPNDNFSGKLIKKLTKYINRIISQIYGPDLKDLTPDLTKEKWIKNLTITPYIFYLSSNVHYALVTETITLSWDTDYAKEVFLNHDKVNLSSNAYNSSVTPKNSFILKAINGKEYSELQVNIKVYNPPYIQKIQLNPILFLDNIININFDFSFLKISISSKILINNSMNINLNYHNYSNYSENLNISKLVIQSSNRLPFYQSLLAKVRTFFLFYKNFLFDRNKI